MTRKNIEKERWKMSKQKYTSIPQAHVDNLYKKIAELEKERDIRDLEQQAKGCTDGAKACSISFGEGVVIGETELDGYAKDLLRQAKALKEGK
jgi:hypothetical protein